VSGGSDQVSLFNSEKNGFNRVVQIESDGFQKILGDDLVASNRKN
jgi:hypothetical protein